MKDNHYRTVGEMMYRDPAFAAHKRNKTENYLSTVRRDQIASEAASTASSIAALPGKPLFSIRAYRSAFRTLRRRSLRRVLRASLREAARLSPVLGCSALSNTRELFADN